MLESKKYTRDFLNWWGLVTKKLICPDIFNHVDDASDSYPGLQKMLHSVIASCDPRYLIEGLNISGNASNFSITEGWVMIDGEVVHLNAQSNLSLNENEFLYVRKSNTKFQGETAIDNISNLDNCIGFPVCKNEEGQLIDVRNGGNYNERKMLSNVNVNTIVANTLNVDNDFTTNDMEVSGDLIDKSGNYILGFPIGTILPYDGVSWIDNTTIPGWYACTSNNTQHGCPNLVDKFIMGGGGSVPLKSFGGSENPSHTHNVTTQVSVYSEAQYFVPPHYHGLGNLHIYGGSHTHTAPEGGTDLIGQPNIRRGNTLENFRYTSYSTHDHPTEYFSGRFGSEVYGYNGDEGFYPYIEVYTQLSNSMVTTTTSTYSTIIPYYAVIFIRRCA